MIEKCVYEFILVLETILLNRVYSTKNLVTLDGELAWSVCPTCIIYCYMSPKHKNKPPIGISNSYRK